MLNNDQILSAVRWVLTTLGTYLVAHNLVASTDFATAMGSFMTIVGAALPLASLVWSMVHHSGPVIVPPPPPSKFVK